MLKLFVNNFWSGFIEKKDVNHIGFFLDLFELVYSEQIVVSTNVNECDILLESVCGFSPTLIDAKKWKHTYLFSGEHHLNQYSDFYDCVIWGEENHNNVVNLPLYVIYTHCSNFTFDGTEQLDTINNTTIPEKDICCVISDVRGTSRNHFIECLEKHFKIDHYGKYKNNMPRIEHRYDTKEFSNIISQYKFILTFEKFRVDTYITEKITHGFNAGNVPIYWGSLKIGDYFNTNRFINVTDIDDESINKIVKKIKFLIANPNVYNIMRNASAFKNGSNPRSVSNVANDIKKLLNII
jgi:hypothetical protein